MYGKGDFPCKKTEEGVYVRGVNGSGESYEVQSCVYDEGVCRKDEGVRSIPLSLIKSLV